MKIDQLLPFVGHLVTLQFLENWHALQFHGTMPEGEYKGEHLCHQAFEQAEHDGKKVAVPITARLLGPAKLELRDVTAVIESILPEGEKLDERSYAMVIHAAGPDGSMVEIACDPENIAFVGRCLVPGQPQGKAHDETRIVLP